MEYHNPVLLEESLSGLDIEPDGVYVDLTFGGGGHSRAILDRLGPKGRLLGFDQDKDAVLNTPKDERFQLVDSNFRFLSRFLRYFDLEKVDGILADLGVSSHQIDVPERGFSHRFSGPLDMRMNAGIARNAGDWLRESEKDALQDVFSQYGEVRNSKTLAEKIVEARKSMPLNTTDDLVKMINPVIRGSRPRYLSQVFQALRIAVNEELVALEEVMTDSITHLKSGGRLVIISYHSLEDRIVKNVIRSGNTDGRIEKDAYGVIFTPFKRINKKPIVPKPEEIAKNPRSRSAKLRIAERL
nr:16S rRNA (cytosine(1402)-N(4))-methyltransferase RsmH [Saprospiraceae bacterium]